MCNAMSVAGVVVPSLLDVSITQLAYNALSPPLTPVPHCSLSHTTMHNSLPRARHAQLITPAPNDLMRLHMFARYPPISIRGT